MQESVNSIHRVRLMILFFFITKSSFDFLLNLEYHDHQPDFGYNYGGNSSRFRMWEIR